jgi:hypothetical protein
VESSKLAETPSVPYHPLLKARNPSSDYEEGLEGIRDMLPSTVEAPLALDTKIGD